MSADDDKILYGEGEKVTLLEPDGINEQFVSARILLTNEFELSTIAPRELAPNQESAAFLLTMKGRMNGEVAVAAVTVVFEPSMARALLRSLNQKWRELPVEER